MKVISKFSAMPKVLPFHVFKLTQHREKTEGWRGGWSKERMDSGLILHWWYV